MEGRSREIRMSYSDFAYDSDIIRIGAPIMITMSKILSFVPFKTALKNLKKTMGQLQLG